VASTLAGKYTFFYGKGNENNELGTGFLCTGESAVKRVQIFSDRVSFKTERSLVPYNCSERSCPKRR
jgi:hypothetical protein